MARRQGKYWIATIPRESWEPSLPTGILWIKGQLERGDNTGYEHWQFIFTTTKKESLTGVKCYLPPTGHYELTRSSAAEQYVTKDDTRIGEPFELGQRPFKRNCAADWESIRTAAKNDDLEEIPPDIYIRYYAQLKRIAADNVRPLPFNRVCHVLWGGTGTGKSHRAWDTFPNAYAKDPRSKWWNGYKGETVVIVDEFRGGIDISHILRWIDKYPVQVEIKGGCTVLRAEKFIFTSNLHPGEWYPTIDKETLGALERRIQTIKVESREQIINLLN